ncbi:CapA family protein [Flavobacteriaceae bacterium M23B6Z8]
MISLNFVGDISLFKHYEESNIDPLAKVKLPKSDYNIANFEFIIPNNRQKYFFDVPDTYAVSFEYLKSLELGKFNAYGLSNNHSLDYGVEGVNDVRQILSEKGVRSFGFGERDYNVLSLDINKISIVIISFVKKGRWSRSKTQFHGPDSYDAEKIENKILELKKKIDHVIIFPHWGTELVDVPSPIDVNNARRFIDAGASAVIGHHPHIIQGIEEYNDGIIAYSLGSFIYIPEKEIGYNKKQGDKRNYSICLNLKLSKNKIIESTPYFYYYNQKNLLPESIEDVKIKTYFNEINHRIDDPGYYNQKIRKELLARELRSFVQRFKQYPIKTIIHYLKYIKWGHLKKLVK